MHYLSTPCLPFKQTNETLSWGSSDRIQRKSFDGDTVDMAGVWKHHSQTAQRINLVTKNSRRLSPQYKSFSWNNGGFSLKRRLQVLDGFITLLVASIPSNKRSSCLCVTSETKPNQDKWIPRDVIVGNGGKKRKGPLFFASTSSWHNSAGTTNVPFRRQGHAAVTVEGPTHVWGRLCFLHFHLETTK